VYSTELESDPPLVVDVDDALLKTDLLVESVFGLLAHRPLDAFRLPRWLASGKAVLKRRVANRIALSAAAFPYNDDVLDLIRREQAQGRRIFLASASDEAFVGPIAEHIGADGIFASDGVVNLSRERKAQRLVEAFGERGFDYVGNGRDDLPVWAVAREAFAVNPAPAIVRAGRRVHPRLQILGRAPAVLKELIRAFRPLQWLKNLLVFVPVLAAHRLDAAGAAAAGFAFVAFSLGASSAYLVNDLADVQHDRAHPRKRLRPFASGALPVVWGVVAAPLMLVAALGLALTASPAAFAALAAYYAITVAYSFSLKRRAVVDVMTLAALYTIRIAGGAAAAHVAISEWLLAFSTFVFLALAVVKRCGELARREGEGSAAAGPAGRGYRIADLPVLSSLGSAAGFCAVLVLALYINSEQVVTLYRHPQFLWACCFLLVYWIARMILMAQRGEIHDDPVVFAVRDKPSLLAFALIVLAAAVAI
jgi:4-hydroxybenzoate polyprenyltransferase